MNKRIPNKIVVKAITFIFLTLSIIPDSTRPYPIIITGIDETKILNRRALSFKNFKISLLK